MKNWVRFRIRPAWVLSPYIHHSHPCFWKVNAHTLPFRYKGNFVRRRLYPGRVANAHVTEYIFGTTDNSMLRAIIMTYCTPSNPVLYKLHINRVHINTKAANKPTNHCKTEPLSLYSVIHYSQWTFWRSGHPRLHFLLTLQHRMRSC